LREAAPASPPWQPDQEPASELLPQHRQSSPIPIAEAETPPAELLAEHLNLFTLVFDQLLLVAAQPHADPCC